MSGGRIDLTFAPPGPVAAAFLADRSPEAAIMGPIGSAKTSTAIMKGLIAACQQAPAADGVRYSRGVILRDTYRRLHQTVLRSWHTRVPQAFGQFRSGGQNAPSEHHLRFRLPDGTTVDCEVIFAAVGDADAEMFCRGFEVTWAYINEADGLPEDLLVHLPGRLGRYPSGERGEATWRGLWLDFNAPDTEHFLYRRFVEEAVEGRRLFVQPGALSAQAENLHNLPPGYYDGAMRGQPEWWVRRFIRNEWGYSREGQPVYPEWNDQLHVAADALEPIRGVPIIIGGDAGLTPAAALVQMTPMGQLRILDEVVYEGGAVGFADALNRRLALRGWTDLEMIGVCDLAAGARVCTDERTWRDVMAARTKARWRLSPTNAPAARLDAVRVPLTRLIDGAPGLLLSPACKVLRKGFNAGYRYAKRRDGTRGDAPEKNHYSHVHDALQYAALAAGGGYSALVTGQRRREAAQAPSRGQSDYDPFSW